MMEDRGPPWSKHFDNEYQTYYWHNSVTGQSIWSEDEESVDTESTHSEVIVGQQQGLSQKVKDARSTTVPSSSAKSNLTNSRVEKYDDCSLSPDIPGKKVRKLPKSKLKLVEMNELSNGFYASSANSDSASLDSPSCDDSTLLWNPNKSSEKTSDPKIDREISNYSICIFVHASIVEGPMAVVEGILRAAIFLVASVIMILLAGMCLEGLYLSYSFMLLRDVFLSFSASITLCFPGASCLVYRWYRLEDTWELAPIPTIFGWVDSRRFMSFTFGNGCFARNVRHDDYFYDSLERSGNNDNGGIQYTSSLEQEQIDKNRIFYDSWSGVIFLEPRRVQADIIRIVRGDDTLGILNGKKTSSTEKYFPLPNKNNDDELVTSI